MNWIILPIIFIMVGPIPPPEPIVTKSPAPLPTFPAIKVMSVGDSITYGIDGSVSASYRRELSRLMTKTGQPFTWSVAAMPGTNCHHWALYIEAAIIANDPDVIFLDCGTNDTPTDNTEADYRTILNIIASHQIQVVASFIGIPDMKSPTNTVRPYILDWMHNTNLAIARVINPCLPTSSCPTVPYGDMQRIPNNPEWLQADGIHLTSRAEAAYGQIFYQAARSMRGWKTFSQMGMYEMCGLSGSWITDPWPTNYRVCTQ